MFRHKTFVYAAALLWLFASVSGLHGHFCFDGQEAKISVHMDGLSAHAEHSGAQQGDAPHQDVDVDLSQPSLAKLFGADSPFVGMLVILFLVLRSQAATVNYVYPHQSLRHRVGMRPPLRAPPFLPA